MLTERRVGDQVILHDREATEALYRQADAGDADLCGCPDCRNFIAQRGSAFPASFLELLRQFGVDPFKEGEVYACGPASGGQCRYGGWFHLVGELLEPGPKKAAALEGSAFEFRFTTCLPGAASFQEGTFLALEFFTTLDWVLETGGDTVPRRD